MSSQHHATPEQWQAIEANGHLPTRSTILELRDRVEALEVPNFSTILDLLHRVEALEAAAQPAQPSHSEISGSSLEQRVSEHIKGQTVLTADLVERMATEALEAAAQPAQPNHPAEPDSSLVELVAASIDFGCRHNRDPDLTARAAIRLVATWLQSWHGRSTASTAALEREVER